MRRQAALLTLALLVAAGTEAPAADGPRWCSGSRALLEAVPGGKSPDAAAPTEERVDLLRRAVAWDLDVHGASASGLLTERFVNDREIALEVRYWHYPAAGFETERPTLELEGSERDLATAPPRADRDARGRFLKRPVPGFEASEPFEVPPGASFAIRTPVRAPLRFEGGWFELELPVTTHACARARGATKPEGDAGAAREAELSVSLRVHHEEGSVELEGITHALERWSEPGATAASLAEPARIDDGPFALRYRLADADPERPALAGWVSEPREDGTRDVMVVLTPPVEAAPSKVRATDVVFVLDTSGSMRGAKLKQARAGLAGCFALLDSGDEFSVLGFSSGSRAWSEGLVGASAGRVEGAADWLDELEAEGGTQLRPALLQALSAARGADDHPIVVVLTDGAIHDAAEVEELLRTEGGRVRVLFVGIGAEPSEGVLRHLAASARGDAAFARDPAQVVAAVTRLFGSFSAPVAWDLELEWEGAEVQAAWPARVPDLYAGRPVTIFARVRDGGPAELRLRGATVDGESGLERVIRLDELPESRGLRAPAALDRSREEPRRGR
jgi:Ca-activated chloride channel family protein